MKAMKSEFTWKSVLIYVHVLVVFHYGGLNKNLNMKCSIGSGVKTVTYTV